MITIHASTRNGKLTQPNDAAVTQAPRKSIPASWSWLVMTLLTGALLSPNRAAAEGTWTKLTNQPAASIGTMLLLPNGKVMASTSVLGATTGWYSLTPDSTGSYIKGTWTNLASMNFSRLYFSSQVLQDGRVFVAGGEYGTGTTNAEVYQPWNNSWFYIPVPSGLITTNNVLLANGENTAGFSDSGSVLLANGNVLTFPVHPATNGNTVIFNPHSNTLSVGPKLVTGANEDEASTVKLPDDSILVVNFNSTTTERYIPSLNKWIADAGVPANLYDPYGLECGASFLLPNGKAFYLGSNPVTDLYTPSGNTNAGTWTTGPNLPGLGAPDAPAAMMANGKILCEFSPTPSGTNNVFNRPTYFFEYDYSIGSTGAFTQIHAPDGNFAYTNGATQGETYSTRMLDLPDGSVLYSDGTSVYVYQPGGTPLASGKPVVQHLDWNPDGTLHLTGTLFNGISQGAGYGDDVQIDSNYPLIRFTSSGGSVYYGTTSNWSSTGVMTGTNSVTTEAFIPAPVINAVSHYTFQVVANGIASDAYAFNPLFIQFSPLTNNQTVFDLSQIGGTMNEYAAVNFRIQQYGIGGSNDSYWNGTNWIANGNDPSVYLSATVPLTNANYTWKAPSSSLPGRAQTRGGPYFIRVIGTDFANNTYTNEILVNRTAADTTPPVLTMNNYQNGDTITNTFLPSISGFALDNETGISSVVVYLNRFSGGNVLYWTGSAWTSTPTALPTTYTAQNVTWQVTAGLPSGGNLPNAGYQVQAIAYNNEGPVGSTTLSISFSVDYHPIFVFNYGSRFGQTPNLNWNDPANWDVGTVPTSDAHVIIDGYSPDNTSLGSLQLYRLDLLSGTLTTSGMLITNLYMSGGNLNGGSIALPANGVFNWSGGTFAGSLTVPASATFNITGSGDVYLVQNTTLNLAGKTVWSGTGTLYGGYGVNIQNSGLFSLQSDAQFYNITGSTPLPAFNNTGTLQKTNSNGTSLFSPNNGGWSFNNSSLVDIESGVLSLQSSSYLNPGSTFTGPGVTSVDGGTVLATGLTTMLSGGTLQLNGGTLDGPYAFGGPGTFVWNAGSIIGGGTIQTNGNFLIQGPAQRTLSGSITNRGRAVWTNTALILVGYTSVFENDGSFIARDDGGFYNYTGSTPLPVFINNGTFTKTNSLGSTTLYPNNGGVAFNNNGTVNVASGSLLIGGGGTSGINTFKTAAGSWIDFNAGSFNFNGTTTFSGAGTNEVTSASLTFNNVTCTLSGASFTVNGGNLYGTNTVNGTGAFNWSGGSISAVLGIQSGVGCNIIGAADKTLATGGRLSMAGNSTWSGTGTIMGSYDSVMVNSGTLLIQSDATYYNYTGSTPAPLFVNNGTFTKTNSAGTTVFAQNNGGVAFNNNGTLNVASGSVSLGGGGSAGVSTFKAAAGTWVDFYNGSFLFNGNTAFSGAGTNEISNATLTFNTVTNTLAGGFFAVNGGTIAGTNSFAGTGTFNWSGGSVSAVLNLQSGVGCHILDTAAKYLTTGATFSAAGNTLWTDSGTVYVSYSSVFINKGTFTAQDGPTFYNYTGSTPQPLFVNNGTFIKSGTNSTSYFSPNNGGVAFNNNGIINVQTGGLDLGGGGVGTNGTFTASSGARIDLSGGGFDDFGTLAISGAGLTRLTGATFTLHGGTTTLSGTCEIDSGTLAGSSAFAGSGTFRWIGGNIGGNFTLPANMTMSISGSTDKYLNPGATLGLAGSTTWTGTGSVYCGYASSINNNGIFVAQNDSYLGNYTGSSPVPVFNNTGTFRKTGAATTTTFSSATGGVNFNNSGVLDLQSGTVSFNGGTFVAPSATTKLVLNGTNALTQFGVETFGSPAVLDGTLAVSLGSGFMPTNGQSFVIANYPSVTGQFSVKQLPALAYNYSWSVDYGATALILRVVPQAVLSHGLLTSNGHYQVTLNGPNASSAVLWASSNLVTWQPIATNAPFNGSVVFDDPNASHFTNRFYKTIMVP